MTDEYNVANVTDTLIGSRDLYKEMLQGVNEATERSEVCQVQKFMEQESLNRGGVQVSKPLFISCPCKRCSPFTL